MEIENIQHENGYHTIKLEKTNDVLTIMFGGNGDLYWNIYSKNDGLEDNANKKYFTITKENYEIFLLFSELYRRIDECDVYRVDQLEEELCFDAEEVVSLHERTKAMNDDLSDSTIYAHLCSDTSIVWHSDDAPYGEGNSICISRSRDREEFLICFTKGDKNKDDFSVEISNSGSRYCPFNNIFMEHYNKLCEIDPNYHQIHIEEILYQKRLAKRRESK